MVQTKKEGYISEEHEALKAVKELANEELMPIAHKLKGMAGLMFSESASGREFGGDELNGISAILGGLADDVRVVYDKLHVVVVIK